MGAPDTLVKMAGGDPDQIRLQQQNQELQKQVDLQKALAASQPQMPEIQTLLDPTTGLLKDQYQMKWAGDINPDMRGMDAFRDMALGTGPSAWAQAALNAQGLDEQKQRQNAQELAGSSAAQARSAMASKYGLSPAAQERLAKTQMRNQMTGLQNVGLAGAKARADIGLQDANTRNQFLQALPGQENALAQIGFQNRAGQQQVDAANIQGAIAQKDSADKAAMDKYHEQMSAWAAKQNADATRAQSSGGK